MKKVFCILCSFLFVCVLSACEEAEPVMLPASSGGAGRTESTAPPEDDRVTVCLDPGHGFDDVGTDSAYLGTLAEKDITLAVALFVQDKLEAMGYNVLLTHDGDTFPKTSIDDGNKLFNPKERIDYANSLDIDFYLSLHCDTYAADPRVMGTRIYYSSGTPYTAEATYAAGRILQGINAALPTEKPAVLKEMEYDAAYYVIRVADVPAVLIEMGFVTNQTDAENMLDEAWQEAFAVGIATGIDGYFNN